MEALAAMGVPELVELCEELGMERSDMCAATQGDVCAASLLTRRQSSVSSTGRY
jgi:hypothetical protein